jgi:hypothetical protein
MTDKQGDVDREKNRSAAAGFQQLRPADRRQERHDLWEALNKALNTLMVGHAAGLVTCLTLMKDYKENPQLDGLGTFIALFGCGLVVAVIAVMVWVLGRGAYVVLPSGRRVNLNGNKLFWCTLTLALGSTFWMAAAILIAVFKFATL